MDIEKIVTVIWTSANIRSGAGDKEGVTGLDVIGFSGASCWYCTSTVAEHDVIPTAMFLPVEIFIICSLIGLIFRFFFEHAHTPLMSMRSYWLKQGQKVQDKIEIVNSKSLGQSHCQFHQCDIVCLHPKAEAVCLCISRVSCKKSNPN